MIWPFHRRTSKKPRASARRKPANRYIPRVESLEDRMVLSYQLRLEQVGFADLLITDNGTGDSNPAPGMISYTQAYGTFLLNVTTGASKPAAGNGTTQAALDLNSFNMSTTTGGTLKITLSDTDFSFPGAGANPMTLESQIGGTLTAPGGSSVTFQSWANAANLSPLPGGPPTTIPAGSTTPGQLGPYTTNAYDGALSTTFNRGPGPYSLFSQATIVLTGPGHAGFNGITTVTGQPPPALAKLGDFVWHDLDNDGIQDGNEPGVNGVTVKLQDAGGNILATTTTSGNGMYMFNDLVPGTYKVMFVAPPGFTFSPANQGLDDTLDTDADVLTGMTQVVTLLAGEQNLTLDAGLCSVEQLGSEGGTPGYWKNNAAKHGAVAWGPTGYSPNQAVASVFSSAGLAPYTAVGSQTLLQALSNGGGGVDALLRQAVAAVLNAAHPLVHYPIPSAQVIQQVNAALSAQNASVIEALKNQLDAFNNLRHPLNQKGERT